jgi:arylsulfatase A-like enzyme
LELVNLERKKRTLVIDFVAAATGTVRVRAGGRDFGAFPLSDPLELPLSMEALPLGRMPVDLTFEGKAPAVLAAAVRPVSEGEGRAEGSNLIQRGSSLIDFVRPVNGGEVLVGSFVPPSSPLRGQRFDLTVEKEDGSAIGRFSWTPGFWNRRGRRKIEIPLGNAADFVRIRLRSSGSGPAGTWEGLGFVGGAVQTASNEPTEISPQAAPPRLVVVYVMDALRADRIGRSGASPTSGRLAREGILFKAHRSVAPNTLPSTKALFTGRAFVSRGGWKLAPEDGPTLAEIFRAAGYRTGLFSGNVHVGPAFGLDRGFEHAPEEVILDGDSRAGSAGFNDNAARVHAAALSWLRSLPPDEKAFLYLHTIHPHNPYDPPEPFRSRFTRGIDSKIEGDTRTLKGIEHKRITVGPADRERLKGLYTGSFAYNDAELGKFLTALATWAPPSQTFVALTSDHGEELFDHEGVLHGYTLYEEMLRIPLIVWAPGRLRPAAIKSATDTLDLHATLLDLAGRDPAVASHGASLLRRDRPDRDEPRLAAASSLKGGLYAAWSRRFKLIWAPRTGFAWGMGGGWGRSRDPEYVFDLVRDPGETVNLAGSGAFEVAWLRSRLRAWAEKERIRAEEPERAPDDPETRERLRALGYVN